MKSMLLAVDFAPIIAPVLEVLNALLWPCIAIVGAVGTIYCIFLGIKIAKSDEQNSREKAKKDLIGAIVGFLIIFILMVALKIAIPRNTKVRTSFYKGVTVADVILGLVGLGLAALAVASNLPYRLFIALGIACLFIPLFIPVGEERIYKCALYLARHIFSRKKYTEKGKDAANIQSIVPYERLDGNCIVNKDGGFTGVLEIKPIEFRLLGANKQNYLIDGVLTNVLTSVGASQEAAIVKLEKPLDFDKHIQADLDRIVALAEANENGNLSDVEYAARIDVIQDRLALADIVCVRVGREYKISRKSLAEYLNCDLEVS